MQEINQNKLNCIIKIVNTWLDYQHFMRKIPGLSLGIIHKDKLIFSKGYGYSNIKQEKRTTDKTLYRIASISKIFTAISIMQLVEKEKVRLDDSVSKYLSWFKSEEKITLRQLLTHSSGISRDGNTPHWINDEFPEIEEIKKQVSKGASIYSPIEKFKYSNLGYTLLGSVIEQVSGISYSDYVKTNILDKLNLKETYPDINKDAEKRLAQGYGREIPGVKREEFKNPSTKSMTSATGFISNVTDLCKFTNAAFLTNDLLLNKDTKKEMQRIQWVGEIITWGIGYEIWKNDNLTLRGHSGGFAGFDSQIAFDNENEIGVVILINSLGNNSPELTNGVFHIINYIINNYNEFKPKKSVKDLTKYEGRFYDRWGDVEIVEINGALNFFYPFSNIPLNEIYKLKHKKDNVFSIETGNNFDYIGEEVVFECDKSNNVVNLKIGPNTLIPFNDFIKNRK